MSWMQMLQRWGLVGMGLSAALLGGSQVKADEFPVCAPPDSSEYLLLIQGETVGVRDRIQNLLPAATQVSVCGYLDSVVVRAGGFTSLENANAWAQYLTEVEGAQAFVVRPATPGEVASAIAAEPVATEPVISTAPAEPVSAAPTTTAAVDSPTPVVPTSSTLDASIGYAPKLLGEGYAVLVDYQNNPAVAKQLQQTLDAPVGLAVYEQQPFLLALQSADAQAAAQILQVLSSNRFGAFIVDSSEVVLLSSGVATP